MTGSFRTFWLPGFLGLIGAALVLRFDLASRLPFVEGLLKRSGTPGTIAWMILVIVLWVLLAVLIQFLAGLGEAAAISEVRTELQQNGSGIAMNYVDHYLTNKLKSYGSSRIRHRFRLLDQMGDANIDHASTLLSGQSGLDMSHSEASFGPLRALVWALPAFGFLGTATELSYAVGGLGSAIANTNNYSELRNFLVLQVVPPLASSFDITVFALGSSVLCYVVLSLVHTFEQRTLLAADAAALDLLAVTDPTPPSPVVDGRPSEDDLKRYLESLASELQKSNELLDQFTRTGTMAQIGTLVLSIDRHLEAIRSGLDRDLVVTRR